MTEDVSQAPSPSRARNALFFLLKVLFAGALIGWLLNSGKLDLGALRVLWQDPTLFAANLFTFLFVGIIFATTRWRLLLTLAGVKLPWGRALMLQTVALFFNVVIPGNVGGDVIKALYVARDEDKEKRAAILLVVLVERVVGLMGLIATACIAVICGGPTLWRNPGISPILAGIGFLAVVALGGPVVFVLALKRWSGAIKRFMDAKKSAGFLGRIVTVMARFVEAAHLVVSKPRMLLGAILVSMAMHGITMAYFTLITRAITAHNVDYVAVATVFPIGLLSIVLPISPAGFGVGHMAFEKLYLAIGLQGGATIFNVYLIGQMVPCVLGAIPYFALRRREPTIKT